MQLGQKSEVGFRLEEVSLRREGISGQGDVCSYINASVLLVVHIGKERR